MFSDTTHNILNFLLSRHSGLLVHPTCLPGEFGIGELGSNVFRFLDFLYDNTLNLWQILPLGPTGYGNSPYQCFSTFAGNPMLISLEKVINLGLLDVQACKDLIDLPSSMVDYGKLIPLKWNILKIAFYKFKDLKLIHVY